MIESFKIKDSGARELSIELELLPTTCLHQHYIYYLDTPLISLEIRWICVELASASIIL
jgi:hypothetical protein